MKTVLLFLGFVSFATPAQAQDSQQPQNEVSSAEYQVLGGVFQNKTDLSKLGMICEKPSGNFCLGYRFVYIPGVSMGLWTLLGEKPFSSSELQKKIANVNNKIAQKIAFVGSAEKQGKKILLNMDNFLALRALFAGESRSGPKKRKTNALLDVFLTCKDIKIVRDSKNLQPGTVERREKAVCTVPYLEKDPDVFVHWGSDPKAVCRALGYQEDVKSIRLDPMWNPNRPALLLKLDDGKVVAHMEEDPGIHIIECLI